MHFEWDPTKAISNAKKHGVTFTQARSAVLDPFAWRQPDNAQGDGRELLLGRSSDGQTLFVVLLEVHHDLTRIISARRATAHERRLYEEG